MSNGKGDKTRPKTVSYEVWEKNWKNIFSNKEKNQVGLLTSR